MDETEDLRDVFAVAALVGLLASALSKTPGSQSEVSAITQVAYRYADAMVKERNRGQQ